MVRKSLLASAISLALLPNVAGALGLGGIRTQSALNEPFLGQIELLDVPTDELDTVKVELASEDEFAKVGTERPHYLTKLTFKPQVLRSGRAVIRAASSEPIREPFLDFLIEVNWPKGRLIKEYTVLLDPPVTLDRLPPRQARLARPPASVDTSAFPMRYGPVEAGTNLWRIARSMAQTTGASLDQTAMALYRTNQHAFVRGDINKLRTGQVLEIPTAAELFALDKRAAAREFKAAVRGGRVAATPLTDIMVEDRLEIAVAERAPTPRAETALPSDGAPTVEGTAPEGASQASSALLPGQEGRAPVPGVAEPALGTIQEDLLLVQEAGESTRQETEELRSRIRELEGQLSDIQRLLELSNERFAALQQAKTGQPEGLGAQVPSESPPELEGSLVPGEAVSAHTEDAAPDATLQGAPKDAIKPVSVKRAAQSDQPSWRSIPDAVWVGGVSVALILLLLGLMVSRRRKQLNESLLVGEPISQHPTAAAAATARRAVEEPVTTPAPSSATADSQEPSAYSDFSNLGDDTEEEDILSEADVYIAYGRYRDAETLLEEGIRTSPERVDIKYKLAEAYFGARNVKGLEGLLGKMQLAGEDRINLDQWRRLKGMLEKLKGAGAKGPGPVEASPEQAPISAGFEGIPSAGQSDAQVSDLRSEEGRTLDLDGLDLTSGERASSVAGESLGQVGATSELEPQFKDLSELKDRGNAGVSDSVPPIEPLSEDVFSGIHTDLQQESLEIPPLSTDSLNADITSSGLRKDSGMWDEVATKIDLARAYLEMEDPEAAQIILEEVAQEGNETQRAEAKEMLEQMT